MLANVRTCSRVEVDWAAADVEQSAHVTEVALVAADGLLNAV